MSYQKWKKKNPKQQQRNNNNNKQGQQTKANITVYTRQNYLQENVYFQFH